MNNSTTMLNESPIKTPILNGMKNWLMKKMTANNEAIKAKLEAAKKKAQQEEEDKKKIFMTDYKLNFDNKELYTFHDMIIPGGRNAKLCMIHDPLNKKPCYNLTLNFSGL
jgi:hypothetical protein